LLCYTGVRRTLNPPLDVTRFLIETFIGYSVQDASNVTI